MRVVSGALCTAIVTVLLGALVVACTRPSSRPNVLLVTFDTTRRDHCSLYGYRRPTTPNLDALGAHSVVFDLAYAASSTTAPSHATLFTGLYPLGHRVLRNGIILTDDQHTLAERLSERGWQTAAFVSSFVLARSFGWAQGFAAYDDEFPMGSASMGRQGPDGSGVDRRAGETTDRVIKWLEGSRDPARPFFLFVHYFDPHDPYDPPAPFKGRFGSPGDSELAAMTSRYDEEIAFTDDQLGRLLAVLDRLGVADDTLLIITADHGEGLGQHGWLLHGINVYEELVRIPLLVRWPGQLLAQRVADAPIEQVDILPTVLTLAGLEPEPRLPGKNLAAALRGDAQFERERPVYLHRRLYEGSEYKRYGARGMKFAVRLGRWKYIEGVEEHTRELFDLEKDPEELKNRLKREPKQVETLAAMLASWQTASATPVTAPALQDEDTRQRLRALGYAE